MSALKSTPTLASVTLAGIKAPPLTNMVAAVNAAWKINMEFGGRIPKKLRISADIANRLTLGMARDKKPCRYLFEKVPSEPAYEREMGQWRGMPP